MFAWCQIRLSLEALYAGAQPRHHPSYANPSISADVLFCSAAISQERERRYRFRCSTITPMTIK